MSMVTFETNSEKLVKIFEASKLEVSLKFFVLLINLLANYTLFRVYYL